jgi:NAD(P)-dependent dehydrogenase (short-subunit alcohol dehydrogenase family)
MSREKRSAVGEAREVGKCGITVNNVQPDPIDTDLTQSHSFGHGFPDQKFQTSGM